MARAAKKTQEIKRNDFDAAVVTRAYEFEDGNISFDMCLDGVYYYQLTLVKYKKSYFVSEPQHKIGKGKKEKWLKYYWLNLSDEATEMITDAVLDFLNDEEKKESEE